MSRATILIVEDEAIIAADLANRLRERDYDVVGITARGEEAVDLALTKRPDLVLMDIRLAGAMDGVTAAEIIRRQCDLPVVYLTAHSDHSTLQRAKLTEPFGYILKPFEERELETHIEMALYKHQADRKLREQREWLRTTLTSIGDAVIATDIAGRITFLNPVAESLTGWKEAEAFGRSIASVFRIIDEQTREQGEDVVDRVLRDGRVVNLANNTALIARDGREIPIEDSAAPIRDAAGKVSGAVLVFHDVTEKRRAQEALRRYELLAAHSRDIILFMRRDNGRILDSNAAAAAYGYTREELASLTIQDLRAPETRPLTPAQMAQADTQGILFETVHRRKDRRTFPVEVSSQGATINGTRTLISVIRDITERKRAEEERQSLARFPSENPNPVLRLDADGRILYANAASVALLRQWGRAVGSHAPAPWPDTVRNALGKRAGTTVELTCEDRVYTVSLVPVPSAAYVNLYMSDITDRVRAEQALRQSREELNRAQAVAHTGSWRLDTVHGELRWSDETYRMFGIPQGTPLTYETFLGAVHPEDRQYVEEKWTAAMGGAPYDIEHRIVIGDTVKWVRERAELEFDKDGSLLGGFGTVQDITERKRVEEALARQREWLRTTLTSIGDAVIATDTAGRISFLNPVAESLTGWKEAEAFGQPVTSVFRIINEQTREPAEDIVERVLREGHVFSLANNTALVTRDGREIPIEDSAAPIRDAAGKVSGVVLVFHDVTEKRHAQATIAAERANLQTVFDVVNIGLVLIKDNGVVQRLNNVLSSWVGKDLSTRPAAQFGDLVGCIHAVADPRGCGHTPQCASCPIRNTFEATLRSGTATHHVETEATVMVNGQAIRLWLDVSADPLVLDGERHVILALSDITARKRAEEALRRAKDELEWRVRERTAELSEAIDVLERQAGQLRALASELTVAEQRERRRLADVLHDGLQQLLVAARVRAHMLGRSDAPGVRQGCQEIVTLLEEALGEARTLTGELSPPTLQKGGVLPALEWLTRWMGEKHHLTVHLRTAATPLPPLSEDLSVLLYQAVRELLLNTVKYAQVSTAEVSLTQTAEALTITVADAGVGFDPARLRVLGGTEGGFGLLGIRERLELLGGRLEIQSRPGRGSRFTLIAPLQPVSGKELAVRPPEVSAAVPSGVPARRGMRILVVDDHALVRRGFATLLAGEADLDVVGEAEDGKVAIDLARQLRPDVILMDVNMPVLDGIAATQALHAEFPEMRVIGLSVLDAAEHSEAMKAAGAVSYVRKSDPPEALLAAIRGGAANAT